MARCFSPYVGHLQAHILYKINYNGMLNLCTVWTWRWHKCGSKHFVILQDILLMLINSCVNSNCLLIRNIIKHNRMSMVRKLHFVINFFYLYFLLYSKHYECYIVFAVWQRKLCTYTSYAQSSSLCRVIIIMVCKMLKLF
jgi:hypothetical protein